MSSSDEEDFDALFRKTSRKAPPRATPIDLFDDEDDSQEDLDAQIGLSFGEKDRKRKTHPSNEAARPTKKFKADPGQTIPQVKRAQRPALDRDEGIDLGLKSLTKDDELRELLGEDFAYQPKPRQARNEALDRINALQNKAALSKHMAAFASLVDEEDLGGEDDNIDLTIRVKRGKDFVQTFKAKFLPSHQFSAISDFVSKFLDIPTDRIRISVLGDIDVDVDKEVQDYVSSGDEVIARVLPPPTVAPTLKKSKSLLSDEEEEDGEQKGEREEKKPEPVQSALKEEFENELAEHLAQLEKEKEQRASSMVMVKVRVNGKDEIKLRLEKTDMIKKIYDAVAGKYSIPIENLKIVLDGEKLQFNQTLADFDVEDGDQLDAYF